MSIELADKSLDKAGSAYIVIAVQKGRQNLIKLSSGWTCGCVYESSDASSRQNSSDRHHRWTV